MSTIATVSMYLLFALIVLLSVYMGIFHIWTIFVSIKETIIGVQKQWLGLSPLERKKFLLRNLLGLVMLIILFTILWMYGHHHI